MILGTSKFLILLLACSAFSSTRIVDEKNPRSTNPLQAIFADSISYIEREIKDLEESQKKLQSGELSAEEYNRTAADSRSIVKQEAAKHSDNAAVQTSASRAMIQLGDYREAVGYADRAHALAPEDPFPLTTRSRAYFELKDFPSAARDAKRALELDPKDPVAWSLYNLSKNRPAGGAGAELPASRPQERAALPENPSAAKGALRPDDDPEIARYKTAAGRDYARKVVAAEKALRRKDYYGAYGLANQALSAYADNPRMKAARAVAAWNLKDYTTAIGDATAVLAAEPRMPSMLIARAAAYNDTGHPKEAFADAQKAVALAPESARALLERGLAREALKGPAESALEDFKRAAELDPNLSFAYEQALERLGARKSGVRSDPLGYTANGASSDNDQPVPGYLKIAAGLLGALGLGAASAKLKSKERSR